MDDKIVFLKTNINLSAVEYNGIQIVDACIQQALKALAIAMTDEALLPKDVPSSRPECQKKNNIRQECAHNYKSGSVDKSEGLRVSKRPFWRK